MPYSYTYNHHMYGPPAGGTSVLSGTTAVVPSIQILVHRKRRTRRMRRSGLRAGNAVHNNAAMPAGAALRRQAALRRHS